MFLNYFYWAIWGSRHRHLAISIGTGINIQMSLLNRVLGVLACSRALRVYVLACSRALCASALRCLRAWCACVLACLRAYVLKCLSAWRTCVLTCFCAWLACVLGMFTWLACLHAYMHGVLACVRACVLVTMKCFIFLRVCALGVLFCLIYFTFQDLNLKILRAKKLCTLSSWTYFLFIFWYQLIKLYETNLRVAEKSIDISYSYSCSKAISIFYNLYIHLLH